MESYLYTLQSSSKYIYTTTIIWNHIMVIVIWLKIILLYDATGCQ